MSSARKCRLILGVFVALVSCSGEAGNPLQDAVVLIIRHAEKPETGPELSAEGQARAQAYVKYFGDFQIDGKPLKLDSLFAAADSKKSSRARLTLEPLSQALKLPLNCRYKHDQPEKLADALKRKSRGKNILICWRHEGIPKLVSELGLDPATLLPGGAWPEGVFDWVIELRYDSAGHLIPGECKRISEHLMP
jgi:hypothetical protein